MQGLASVVVNAQVATKQFNGLSEYGRELFANDAKFSQLLADEGLAPQVVSADNFTLVTETHDALRWHLDEDDREANKWAGTMLMEIITKMHAMGIAHRDLQVHNLVFDGETILVIDNEFACEVDPKHPKPYDIYGPREAWTAPPRPHVVMKIAAHWNSKTVDQPPYHDFGPYWEYL